MAMGQGLETSYPQLVAEVLGLDFSKIKIIQGDTDRANGVGSVGSRSAFVGGSAVVAAGHKVVARGKELAAEALEAAAPDIEYRNGRFSIGGTDRAIGLAELADRQPEKRIRVSATQTPPPPSWPNRAQAIGGEIDPDKGVGELGTIGATPAAVHAVLDALAERGVTDIDMPCTPERVWRALGTRK